VRLTRGGFRRTWFAVMLRDKSAPAYMGEFVKILASRPTPDREVICL